MAPADGIVKEIVDAISPVEVLISSEIGKHCSAVILSAARAIKAKTDEAATVAGGLRDRPDRWDSEQDGSITSMELLVPFAETTLLKCDGAAVDRAHKSLSTALGFNKNMTLCTMRQLSV